MYFRDQEAVKMFTISLKRYRITEAELEHGFFEAFADHMVPATGIEFRHIYKHIIKLRESQADSYKVFDGGTF